MSPNQRFKIGVDVFDPVCFCSALDKLARERGLLDALPHSEALRLSLWLVAPRLVSENVIPASGKPQRSL